MPANQPDGKLWVMPLLLEAFGLAAAFKAFDAFDVSKPWHVWLGYAATGAAMIIGGALWAVFRKKIAELWPWNQLRTARADLLRALQENSDLKRQSVKHPDTRIEDLEEKLNAKDKEYIADVGRALDSLSQAKKKIAELERASDAAGSTLFSQLQIEAFTLAKELRDFLANMPSFPSDPIQNAGEENVDFLERLMDIRADKQGQWRAKLMHGYANRKFGERITALMHRAGEDLGYPPYVPDFAEKSPMSEDDVRKLAQQMEMVGIWINRKVRNEVDLLHPKS